MGQAVIRILHTADWHIGHELRGHAREAEHRAVLGRLVRLAAEREVDAVVVAGDVFDSQNASASSQRLFYETVAALGRSRPGLATVVVAGNHDGAGRLEAPRPLLQAFNVHVVGNVRRRDGRIDAGRHLVPLRGRDGAVEANVLAVSYPTAACLPVVADEGAGSPVAKAVGLLYDEILAGNRDRLDGLPLVVTGHLHVAGGLESEGAERRILVGGQHAVPPGAFPAEADYVALGHLHRAQSIGRAEVRYSGSLMPLSATERSYAHGVTLVELGAGRCHIEHVPIERPTAYVRVPEAGEARLSDLGDRLSALGLPGDLPYEMRPYVQVVLSRSGLGAGFREEVDRIASAFPIPVVDVRIPPAEEPDAAAAPLPGRLADLDPAHMFALAFERRFRIAPGAAHLAVFEQAREGA